MRRDVGPRVVAARNHRRRHHGHAPVLGLQLHRVHVGRPDGHHALATEAAANLGETEIKRETARQDLGRQVPRLVGDGREIPVGVVDAGERVEDGLEAREECARDFGRLGLVELGVGVVVLHNGVEDGCLLVEKGLADRGRLA